MNKTEHYQLNQWDPEDRILRVDFNADNAAIETALKENANAVAAEAAARANADTAIRGELAAAVQDAKNTAAAAMAAEQSARAGEDAAIRNELTNEANTRYAQDTAIRQEFAAADANVAAQNCMVKLAEITTAYTAAQVDVSVAGLNLQQYREVIIYPDFIYTSSSGNAIQVRINNISDNSYIIGASTSGSRIGTVWPISGASEANNRITKMSLFLRGSAVQMVTQLATNGNQLSTGRMLVSAGVTAANISSINFAHFDGAAILGAGSKIYIYGVR